MTEKNPLDLPTPDAGSRHAGDLLRLAREEQGLTLEALAATIKVPPAKLEALEQGRPQALGDSNFARALAMTVCRALKIDSTDVLAGLPAARLLPLGRDKPPLNQPFKDHGEVPALFDRGHGLNLSEFLRVKWLAPLALLVAAAVVYMLPDSFEWPSWQAGSEAAVETTTAVVDEPTPEVIPAHEPVQVVAPMAVASAASEAVSSTLSASAAGSTPALALAAPTPAASAASVASASAVVRLVASEDAWVEARNASGAKVLSRLVKGGETVDLDGAAPFQLRIGNAKGVQLSFKGQAVDLSSMTRNNVARVELK